MKKAEPNLKKNMKKVSLLLITALFTAMLITSCADKSYMEVKISNQIWMAENLNVDKFRNRDPITHAKLMKSELEQQSGTFTDSRDGHTYKWVKIGSQLWMAENLNFRTSNGSWCYDNNAANCNRYGRLYTWQTARGACPPGWHLPTDAEWSQLTNYLGNNPGTKLKARNGWSGNGNGTDNFGFSALPGGTRVGTRIFGLIGYHGYWWSATSHRTSDAWLRIVYYNYSSYDRISDSKELGLSVRCMRD